MAQNLRKIIPDNSFGTKRIIRLIIFELLLLPAIIFSGCASHKTIDKNAETVHYDSTGIRIPVDLHNPERLKNYYTGLAELMHSNNNLSTSLHLEIDKSEYVLSVIHDTSVIKQYPVVFGNNPSEDKLQQGDGRTPEGNFIVRAKYGHRFWSRFIWLDYPNSESMRKFRAAKIAGIIPADASPGGEIGIHGVISGSDFVVDYRQNWTAGCISMKTHDIMELYEYVDSGTVVIIRK